MGYTFSTTRFDFGPADRKPVWGHKRQEIAFNGSIMATKKYATIGLQIHPIYAIQFRR